jgi:ABC-type polar amino acid transport system ATPase subunit
MAGGCQFTQGIMKYQAFEGSPHFFIGRSTKGTVDFVECTLKKKALTCFSLCYLTTIANQNRYFKGWEISGRLYSIFSFQHFKIFQRKNVLRNFLLVTQVAIIHRKHAKKMVPDVKCTIF